MSELHAISEACRDSARKADVVFVHGLMGDPFKTWRHGETEDTSWPHWLAQEFPGIGVWSLGYPAALSKWPHWIRVIGGLFVQLPKQQTSSGHATPLERRAGTTLDRLVQKGLGHKPLIFVCHSLGGLLVKQLVHTAAMSQEPREKDLASSISDVLFLATPHHGADLASLAKHLRSLLQASVIIDDLQAHGAHLESLAEYYKTHAGEFGIQTHAYYETVGIAGSDTLVVNSTSANPGIGRSAVALDRDHGSICKPLQKDDPVCDRLREILEATREQELAPVPQHSSPPIEILRTLPEPAVVPEIAVHVHLPSAQQQSSNSQIIPCQLPRAASRFFGREDKVKELVARLGSERNTVVAGAAGLGKTALAAEALHQMLGGRPRERLAETPFPDGIVYVDLYVQKDQPQAAWRHIADAVGGRDLPQNTTDDIRAREACRGKQLLLIIEGGEEADGGLRADGSRRPSRHSMIDPLQWEGSVLWLTRPTPTSPVGQITLDAPLSEDEADALLLHLTAGAPLPVDDTVRRALAEGLGRHPLALTWAGGLLQRGGLRPQRLVEELQQQPARALHDPEDARHTLQWLFERSVRLLDTNAHDTLAAAGLLAHAPFPLHALCAATGLPTDVQETALRQCVQSRLLELDPKAHPDHWHFGHALGHHFAAVIAEDLAPERRETMLQRLMQWTDRQLQAELAVNAPAESLALAHAQALLQACASPSGWEELAQNLLYSHRERLSALGRLGECWAIIGTVEAWWLRIVDEVRKDAQWQREAAALQSFYGNVLIALGDLSSARRRYEASLQIIEALVENDRENAVWQHDLSVSFEKLGDVVHEQGDFLGAQVLYQAGLRTSESLAVRYPNNATWQQRLAVSLSKLGDVLQVQGDLSGAHRHYEMGFGINKAMAALDSDDAERQRDLSVSMDKLGAVLLEQGDLVGAQRFYEAGLQISQTLSVRDPESAVLQHDLSVGFESLGDVLREQGNLVGAQRHYEASFRIRECLVARYPQNAGWQRALAVTHNLLGDVLQAQGDLSGARWRYEAGLRIRESLTTRDPENSSWRRDLILSWFKLGLVSGAQGDAAGQRAHWVRAQSILQALVQRWPEHPQFRKELEVLDGAIASLDA